MGSGGSLRASPAFGYPTLAPIEETKGAKPAAIPVVLTNDLRVMRWFMYLFFELNQGTPVRLLLLLKRFALHQGMDEFTYRIRFLFSGANDFVGQISIGKTEGATQSIPD